MENAIIYEVNVKGTPTVCRYDITVTYEGERNTYSKSTIFVRMLVAGQVVHIQQGSPIVKASVSNYDTYEVGGFFLVPWASTPFAMYICFKDPQREGTLLEAKFHPSQLAKGRCTWDIVGSKFLQNACSVSLELHILTPDQRLNITHETKTGTTSLRRFAFSDQSNECLDREKQFLQKLVDSPLSEARADALIVNGIRLLSSSEHLQYFDLSIQALCAGRAHTQAHPRHVDSFHMTYCHILFSRCTLPGGDIFVDRAFDALKGLDIIPRSESGFSEPFMSLVLHSLGTHPRPHFATLTFRILASSIIARRSPRLLTSAAILAVNLAPKMEETLTILDNTLKLPGISSLIPLDNHGILLVFRAGAFIDHYYSAGTGISHDAVVAAIESVQTHFPTHESTKMINGDSLGHFLGRAAGFLAASEEEHKSGTALGRYITFLNWALSLELESELELLFAVRRACMLILLWVAFTRGLAGEKSPRLKEIIRFVYSGYSRLTENLVEYIRDQMVCLGDGGISWVEEPGLGSMNAIEDFLEYSLSIRPHDQTTLIRAIIAATLARPFTSPIAMKCYQLLMSSDELFDQSWMIGFDGHPINDLSITSDAISYALASGCHDLALEWIDQSSCRAWRRIIGFRSSFTQVAAVNSELAEELTEVATNLLGPSENERNHHYAYARRWHNAVSEARKLPGFDRFLKPKIFVEIQSVVDALGGPVVHLTIDRFSCHALCVLPNLGEVLHIPLPHIQLMHAKLMSVFFRHLISGVGTEEVHLDTDGSRLGKLVKDHKLPHNRSVRREYVSFPTVLEFLWRNIVKPVLDGLAIPHSESPSAEKLPRLWWCPFGYLDGLPFHAAGLYKDSDDDNIMNYVVSSYVSSPSLASRITRVEATIPNPRFLAVGNPSGCGLPGTEWELEIVQKHMGDTGPITELVGASATPDAVKQGLLAATWVHFACHGVNVAAQPHSPPGGEVGPMDSSLILANHAHLPVVEISKLALPQAQFAFLSACETAQEGVICYGESPHLAAAMLVAGFQSVVGTMWRISDYYAPYVADHFYQKMFEGAQGQVPDHRRSAYALHHAVKKLREEHHDNPDFRIWVPFVHYGA